MKKDEINKTARRIVCCNVFAIDYYDEGLVQKVEKTLEAYLRDSSLENIKRALVKVSYKSKDLLGIAADLISDNHPDLGPQIASAILRAYAAGDEIFIQTGYKVQIMQELADYTIRKIKENPACAYSLDHKLNRACWGHTDEISDILLELMENR